MCMAFILIPFNPQKKTCTFAVVTVLHYIYIHAKFQIFFQPVDMTEVWPYFIQIVGHNSKNLSHTLTTFGTKIACPIPSWTWLVMCSCFIINFTNCVKLIKNEVVLSHVSGLARTIIFKIVIGFVKIGFPHTANLQTLTCHNLGLERGFNLNFGQWWALLYINAWIKFQENFKNGKLWSTKFMEWPLFAITVTI